MEKVVFLIRVLPRRGPIRSEDLKKAAAAVLFQESVCKAAV